MVRSRLDGKATDNSGTRPSNVQNESAVISFTTPMTIKASANILVTCSCPIKAFVSLRRHILVTATTPTLLTAPTTMRLEQADDLGTDFARGWEKLPEEIKLHILSYNLDLNGSGIYYDAKTSCYTSQDRLSSHLAMGPEIARLAYGIFYKRNKFALEADVGSDNGRLWLPSLVIRPLITKVCLKVGFDQFYWRLLQELADKSLGFNSV
jgi:hypothetical protein